VRTHDRELIMSARGLRSFAYGMLSVILAVALTSEGFDPFAIGFLITVSLIGDLVGTYVAGVYADRWGRRKMLVCLALLMTATGLVFGLTDAYPVLLIAAFFGTLGTSASETAPFLPIDQGMIAESATGHDRTSVFVRYNLIASFAAAGGALAAGLPSLLTRWGIQRHDAFTSLFVVYAILGLFVAFLTTRLSSRIEATRAEDAESERLGWQRVVPPLHQSRGIILRLSGLFSVDAFAGGLVVQSLMALYFHLRFGVPLGSLAVLFFLANTASALSFLAAGPLAKKFGLLNTMVFTHLPSNVLLILVPLMPVFPLAAAVLVARQLLSQMDVPTRQAYTMALVAPSERTASASVTSLARSLGSSTSPVASGLLLQGPLAAFGIPFILAGGLKAAYDLVLWRIFRKIEPMES
jgi:MFS family permease